MNITGVWRAFHPNMREYMFFSVTHRMFFKIDYILLHKASINRNKKIEITICILSDPWIKPGFSQQKTFKLMETEQFTTEWLQGQGKNKKK